jgi:hypothetical protein
MANGLTGGIDDTEKEINAVLQTYVVKPMV